MEDSKGEQQADMQTTELDHILRNCFSCRVHSSLVSEQQAGRVTKSFCLQAANVG